MRKLKMTMKVPKSRHIEIHLPDEVPEGDVEVTVQFSPANDASTEQLPRGHWKRVEAMLAEWDKVERPRMTGEEIDAYLAEERASWGDDP